jgi:hypothetical protein
MCVLRILVQLATIGRSAVPQNSAVEGATQRVMPADAYVHST